MFKCEACGETYQNSGRLSSVHAAPRSEPYLICADSRACAIRTVKNNRLGKRSDPVRAAIDEAKEKGFWFHWPRQDIWLTPEQVEADHADGKPCLRIEDSRLRNPCEAVEAARCHLDVAAAHLADMTTRVYKSLGVK